MKRHWTTFDRLAFKVNKHFWPSLNLCLHALWASLILLILNKGLNPNWNGVSIGLTILEIFLVVVAFAGFWLIKSETRDTAKSVAEEETRLCVAELAPSQARRAAISYMRYEEVIHGLQEMKAKSDEGELSIGDLEKILDALADEENGA